MMTTSANSSFAGLLRRSSLGLGAAAAVALPTAALAQITPDGTLENEGSTLTEGAIVRNGLADLVEGGAIRGSNLFHSFLEFNIDAGQRVYFANPSGVESILSRVTGANPSNIFGTLGVDGAADLFLINPNGLVFGETAALDIEGSFYATTAAAIPLGDGIYSATEPAQSSLLTVSPSALFSSYLTQASGDIENRGQLAVQGDLTLAGNRLDLQGQVAAGGDLTLLGNAVQIRDAADTPFVGFAGGDLLVQGNEGVDIVALSHPDSGLYSYGDMVLRSANPVGGDAHYFSGGSFRVETLQGEAGGLFSPIDPIIRSFGDVVIDEYEGSSLHILAGGSVFLGTATIRSRETGVLGVDFLRESVELSDGTVVEVDGGVQPTLDVRAGVLPEAVGALPLTILTGFDPATDRFLGNAFETGVPSSADITVGDVFMAAPNGLVLLTTQYQPNADLARGNISVTGDGLRGFGIDARGFGGQGGAVYIDAYSNVFVTNSSISTSGAGAVGDVVINAGGTVRFERQNRPTGVASNLTAGVEGTGGNIQITATNVDVLNGAQLTASTLGNGDAGSVVIQARDRIIFDNSDAFSDVRFGATGTGGNLEITTDSLEVINGAQLSASTFGAGDAGNVLITASDRVVFGGTTANGLFRSAAFSTVEAGAIGGGGNVEITANSLEVIDGAQLSTNVFGNGDAGNVLVTASDRVVFDGSSANGQFSSEASSRIEAGATGRGGDIEILASSVAVTNGAQLSASTSSTGDAGSVLITASGHVVFGGAIANGQFRSGALSTVEAGAIGAGGNVVIAANSLEVSSGAGLSTSTSGNGSAGNVVITVQDRVVFDSDNSVASSRVEVGGIGAGGNVEVIANSLEVTNGARLTASTLGSGDAGNVIITTSDHVLFDGGGSAAFSAVGTTGTGSGGNILIAANSLNVINGAQLLANTEGAGDAGSVVINAQDYVVFDGRSADGQLVSKALSTVEAGATGVGGNVEVTANSLAVTGGAELQASTRGTGDAGDVAIDVSDRVVFDDGSAFSTVEAGATGTGGNILISAAFLEVLNSAQLAAGTIGTGNAGNVVIEVSDRVIFDGGSAFSIVEAGAIGTGGNISISASSLEVLNGSQLTASALGNGNAGDVSIDVDGQIQAINGTVSSLALTASGGRINIRAGNLILRENSDILTLVGFGEGSGGNIEIAADFVIALNDSDILAFSADGQGGDIDLSRTTFFSQNASIGFGSLTREELLALVRNDRVDVNASGGVEPGQIAIGDSSFIENSLTSLADTIIDTSSLTAGSCIARTSDSLGSFVSTGSGGLPQRPGDSTLSTYPTGTVRTGAAPTAAVQEPDGVYQLPDGRLVLSQACE